MLNQIYHNSSGSNCDYLASKPNSHSPTIYRYLALTPPHIYPYDYQSYSAKSDELLRIPDYSYPIQFPTPPLSVSPQTIVTNPEPIVIVVKPLESNHRTKTVIMRVAKNQRIFESKSLKSSGGSDVEDEFICRWLNCLRQFDALDCLASHVAQIHAIASLGGLYYCRWNGCPRKDRGFNARYKMLVHVRTHTKEKPHQCNLCEKSFSRAENLKIHTRSHSGEKPYICPVEGCSKAYSNSSDRFKHTRTHSTQKPYVCKVPGCQKRYTDPSSLRKHVKTFKHTNSEHVPVEKSTLSVSSVNFNENHHTVYPPLIESRPEIIHNQFSEYSSQRYPNEVLEQSAKCNCSNRSPYECYDNVNYRYKTAEIYNFGSYVSEAGYPSVCENLNRSSSSSPSSPQQYWIRHQDSLEAKRMEIDEDLVITNPSDLPLDLSIKSSLR